MSHSNYGSRRADRRHFLKTLASLSLASVAGDQLGPSLLTAAPGAGGDRTRITEVFMDLNRIHKWNGSNGDTWDPFWADDGSLYAFNCDGRGFGTERRNLAFNQLVGDRPGSLVGRMVNSMDEYGKDGEKKADNATWKACGQECIDSVFYAFVSRNVYGRDSGDPLMRQTAAGASLIKSTDRGQTWTRSAEQNYKNPMWPGRSFGAPFFVHYGQNGGNVTQDEADRYVYALSTNGFWNDGDSYVLGRIKREKLANLDASEWTYYAGGRSEALVNWTRDISRSVPVLNIDASEGTYYAGGRSEALVKWTRDISRSVPVLNLPAKCGQTPPCFIPALGVYLMVVWYNTPKMTEWFKPQEMVYKFYQAEHPWGPWRFINSHSDRFIVGGHMYGPSLCARFQQERGSEVTVSLFTAGCPFQDVPSGLYKCWEIPLVLKTTPPPPSTLITSDDPRIVYKGSWHSAALPGISDQSAAGRETTWAGDSVEFTFHGTGIDYIAEKDTSFGNVDIYLDGEFNQNVSLQLSDFPRILQVRVFSIEGLPLARHTIRIVSKSNGPAIIDAFRVYASQDSWKSHLLEYEPERSGMARLLSDSPPVR
jgi:hypothetical protein